MTVEPSTARIIVAVAAVIWDENARFLLIRRSKPPRQGQWSLPGGKVEFGEPLREAVLREIREETGLEIELLGLIDAVDAIRPPGVPDGHYVLIDYGARVVSGVAEAASDAAEIRWVPYADLPDVSLWDETRRVITLSARQQMNFA
jgi:8-oxo-dGTP diphosphatase